MEDIVELSKRRATEAMERFLRVLGHVPDDRLNWSPTPTAKSAFQIAAHCAAYSHAFAGVIRAGKMPATADEFLEPVHARIAAVTTREEAEAMLREGIAETMTALDQVTPEQIDSVIETPIGPTSFRFFMRLPELHLYGHTYQIDYLQTCWDDQEVHL